MQKTLPKPKKQPSAGQSLTKTQTDAEAAPASAFGTLTRPKVKRPDMQSLAFLSNEDYRSFRPLQEESKIDAGKREIRCVVMTEGPGNMVSKNFYGPEAIEDAAVKLNSGKSFINHLDKLTAQLRPVGDIYDLAGFWKDAEVEEMMIKDLGRKGKACVATLVCDESPAGDQALAKAQAQMLFRKAFPDSTEVYAGISIKGQTLEDESRTIPGFEGWHYCVEFAEGLGADIVTQPARAGEFLAIEQVVMEGTAYPDGKNLKKEVQAIMKATELKQVVTLLNAAESELKTTKDGARIKKLNVVIKGLNDKLLQAAKESEEVPPTDGGDGDGPDDGDQDMEAEGMEAIKAHIPQHEGEEDEAYKVRLAKAMKAMQAVAPKAEQVIKPKTPTMPAVHSETEGEDEGEGGGDTHVHIHGESKEAKELVELRAQVTSFKRTEQIGKLKAKALRMITEANIPTDLLSPSDLLLLGVDEAAWKREIARTKVALEGGNSFAISFLTEKDNIPASEQEGTIQSIAQSMKAQGIPVKQRAI